MKMKNQNILVTIIIPIYQAEEYVERCIQSVRNQTYKNLEILLIDDGSEDKSADICDRFAMLDSRITVFHKKNGGLSDARNYGIDRANGEYLAFIDADDYVTEDFIETLLDCCIRNKSDLAVCDYCQVKGEEIPRSLKNSEREVTLEEALNEVCANSKGHIMYTVAWNKLYQKNLFETIRYPVGKTHEDEAVIYKIYEKAQKIMVMDKKMYGYYMSPNGIMRRKYNKSRLDFLEIQKEKIYYFRDKNQKTYEIKSRQQFGESLIFHYYCVRKFWKNSKEQQKKMVREFEKECLRYNKNFSRFVRMNFLFFYHCTDVYYMLYFLLRKIRD